MNTLPTPRASILVIDDVPTNIEVLVSMLEEEDELSVATSGPQALALLAQGLRPDLILLDVMMPEMNGYEVCEALKRDPATAGIPVIFVTAKDDPESESRALACGGVDFIPKPVNKTVVRARVRVQLELARHRQELERRVHERTRELAAARDAAETANRAKSAFLANVSHEFRTPMNHIVGFAHLLEGELRSEQGREWLGEIRQATQSLLALVNGVLELSRSESGALAVQEAEFAIADPVARAIDMVRDAAMAKGLELVTDLAPGLPSSLLDPQRIEQVLFSLLTNAVKFSEHGRIALRVRAVANHLGAVTLRFEVQDQGVGMTEDVQAKLLEDSDMHAASVWGESSGLLAPLLGSRLDAFRDAMAAYEFDAALELLRAAAGEVS